MDVAEESARIIWRDRRMRRHAGAALGRREERGHGRIEMRSTKEFGELELALVELALRSSFNFRHGLCCGQLEQCYAAWSCLHFCLIPTLPGL